MERIINKIHIADSDRKTIVSIDYKEIDDRGSRNISIEWKHKPKPEFSDALQTLSEHVIDIAEFPDNWLSEITVRGVSFSYEKERSTMGMVISATRQLLHSNSPLNISTPHKIEYEGDAELQGDSKIYLTPQCVFAGNHLKDMAEEYLDGAHAADNQIDAFSTKDAIADDSKEPKHILSGRDQKRSPSKETIKTFGMDKSHPSGLDVQKVKKDKSKK